MKNSKMSSDMGLLPDQTIARVTAALCLRRIHYVAFERLNNNCTDETENV